MELIDRMIIANTDYIKKDGYRSAKEIYAKQLSKNQAFVLYDCYNCYISCIIKKVPKYKNDSKIRSKLEKRFQDYFMNNNLEDKKVVLLETQMICKEKQAFIRLHWFEPEEEKEEVEVNE